MNTITHLIDDFLFHCRYEKNLSDKTIKAYKTDLIQFKSYIQKFYPKSKINQINKNSIKNYLKTISKKNKPKTIKRKIATIKSFFSHLEFEETILLSPFHKIRINIKEAKSLPRIIEIATIKKLLSHLYAIKESCKNIPNNTYKIIVRDIAVIELLFSTGLRVSELCNLRRKDVDIAGGSLRIFGKNNNERIIPICSGETKKALAEYYQLFKKAIFRKEYFFINRLNNGLSDQSVRFMLKKHTNSINISKNITPHMFRHTIATLLLEGDVDIRYIQDLLGHSTISTTQIYTHVNYKAQRKILTKKHPRKRIKISREYHPYPNKG